MIAQYAIVIGTTVGFVKLADIIADTDINAMWQMILSVTIPFIISAVVYYITFFRQIRKANDIIAEINHVSINQ
ncbi:hypothetical protein [Ruminococcus flavefaciens]|uniref:hypothetical protein n=1 Tax=Ruminococcus flavefaciens TaxID=1265 RepID=UPI00048B3303|nr:hypothetical protein [Ruminococcus flavefaciens]